MTAVAETRRPRALWGSARRHLEPTYEALLAEGVREGRFTTRGLSALPRQVSIVALLAVVALLASLLLQDAWRAGDLLPVGTQQEPRFLPAALFPVVILALGLG